jgi:branched-chain amino acid transport system ATP-binding protein
MSDVVLRAQDLRGGYDRHTVLRDLSFELHTGEILALLGPNGAGKTTTLMTVAGFAPPISGTVEVMGENIKGKSPYQLARLGLGYVPDDRALFGSLTVRENLKVAKRGKGTIDIALEYFPDLKKRINVRSGALSGGEQQMLVMARALVSVPKILLVDEMSMGLAPAIVARVLPVLRRIADELGTGIVLVEQHVQQALAVADHAIVLVHGDVRMDAPGAEVRADPEKLERAYLGQSVDNNNPPSAHQEVVA